MNRASEELMASTDKEKCVASTSCLLFRGFQGHQKREQGSPLRKKKFHQHLIDPGRQRWQMPLSNTSLYEICLKQGTSASLLGKKTCIWSKHGDINGFHTCCGDGTFQAMVLERSMDRSAAGSVKQGMEKGISGRAARTDLH